MSSSLSGERPDPQRDRHQIPTGTPGLDRVLCGGLPADRVYLFEGDPGSGKTTLGLQFALEGARLGERSLYVSLSETSDELRAIAGSHGWSVDSIHLFDLASAGIDADPDRDYTIFHPAEIELGETTRRILEEIERTAPVRVVFDSLSEMRLLAQSALRYRRQVLAIKQFFLKHPATVLLLDDKTRLEADVQVASLVHGVITLEQVFPDFGANRRRLQVVKLRGLQYESGYHDFVIRRGELRVFPRVTATRAATSNPPRLVSSGLPALDALTGGGIPSGSSTLVIGPAGSGKSTAATRFVWRALQGEERAAMFLFDEAVPSLLHRSRSMGMDLQPFVENGKLLVKSIDPGEMSPGEFAGHVQEEVETKGASVVVIDTLNGYLNSMPQENFLMLQLHELLGFLSESGVLSFLLVAQQGLVGPTTNPVEASYLADNIILIRFFEAAGEVRQAISMLKKRGGEHEKTIREFRLTSRGIEVGEPLRQFRGVLTGVPELLDPAAGR